MAVHGIRNYLLSFLVVLGDVSVLMETKHLRMRNDGKATDVIDVGLVRAVDRTVVIAAVRKPATKSRWLAYHLMERNKVFCILVLKLDPMP